MLTTAAGRLQVLHELLNEPVFDEQGEVIGYVRREPPIVTPGEAAAILDGATMMFPGRTGYFVAFCDPDAPETEKGPPPEGSGPE